MITHTIASQTSDAITAALIQRLPDELHPYIFREIGNPIAVSHVCRAWRRLALANPYLWSDTNINIDHRNGRHKNTKILELYLTRSRPAPICVELHICFFPDRGSLYDEEEEEIERKNKCICLSSLKMIMDHISHIREFKFFLWEPFKDSDEIADIFHSTFSTGPAPSMLESLELSVDQDMWPSYNFRCYPETAPALRKLRLTDVKIFWKSSIFRNLTELYLDNPDETRIDKLFNILRACPELAILYLKLDNIANTTPEIIASTRPANLPYLTEITLHDIPFSIYQVILQNINTSQHANWYFKTTFPPDNMISTMCDTLGATVAHTEISQSRDLILVLENCRLSLFWSHTTKNGWDLKTQRNGVIDVSLGLSIGEDSLYEADGAHSRLPFFQKVAHFISALNASKNITRFSVHFLGSRVHFHCNRSAIGSVLYESFAWTEPLLRVLPGLEHLDLKLFFIHQGTTENVKDTLYYHRRGVMEGMIRNLGQDYSHSNGDYLLDDLLCPHLHSVEIAHGHGSMSGQLINLIKFRAQHGVPIRTLKMTWSEKAFGEVPVSDEWLSEAKKYVQKVIAVTQTDQEDLYHDLKPNNETTGHQNNGALLGYFQHHQW